MKTWFGWWWHSGVYLWRNIVVSREEVVSQKSASDVFWRVGWQLLEIDCMRRMLVKNPLPTKMLI